MSGPLFEATGLGKAYAVPVLAGVDIEVGAGEVHAVIGENGAGKTTLAAIVAGLRSPDAGSMRLRGVAYAPGRRAASRDAGVGFVPQEPSLVPTLTVGESLFLDRLPSRAGLIDRRLLRASAREALSRVGLHSLDPDRRVASLAIGARQLVEFASALARPCALLVLDEPTAALLPAEAEALLREVEARRREGLSVLFITHRLAEVERLADRVSVLRDGRRVATRPARETSREELLALMVGRPQTASVSESAEAGAVALRVEALRGAGFDGVSFELRRGEVVGLAGLRGAGRTAVLRAIVGADRCFSGEVFLRGAASAAVIRTPRDARKRGVVFVPEERQSQGLLLPLSVRANLSLPRLRAATGRLGLVQPEREEAIARPLADGFGVRARTLEQPVAELSGGNQQKVLLARAIAPEADVLLLDEPTRGIDVTARAEIHGRLRARARDGQAVLVASSDLDELIALCDRILVMAEGRLCGEFARPFSSEAILAAAIPGADREGTA